MKLHSTRPLGFFLATVAAMTAAVGNCLAFTNLTNSAYAQVNLVSDTASNAFRVDADLINPWGLVAGPWGALLLARTLGAVASGDPVAHTQAEQARDRRRHR